MFCSTKTLLVLATLWAVAFGFLAFGLTATTMDVRILSNVEMRDVALGSAPTCDASEISNWTCGDNQSICAKKQGKENCSGDCNGCDGGGGGPGVIQSLCTQQSTLIFKCSSNSTANGCGLVWVTPTCVWDVDHCTCFSAVSQTTACVRYQDSILTYNCAQPPP